ncbi:MAG TPA: ABC transporter permease [Amnibacterium sp.]|jgi:ABC-type antimicrobial peptide transport system permease subunit|nr:ABC transporter permease [Amnibacterium sp.]
MFITYLTRELKNRRRQTSIVAIGMALAIALVIVVNAVAGGVKTAQASALSSVYGVGTDITVTQATTTSSSGTQQFRFGAGAGSTSGGTRSFNSAQLRTARGVTAFATTAVTKVAATGGVKAATGVLSLQSTTFSGRTPTQSSGSGAGGTPQTRPTDGTSAGGPSSFGIDSTSVLGYDVSASTAVGPLSSTTLKSGRMLTAADTGKNLAVLDSDYATSASKKVGSTVTIDGKAFTVVGIVKSTSATGASASNVYIPLDTAQKLSGETAKVTTVYVQATSASQIPAVQTALQTALGASMTVNTQAGLASTVTGSVSTAATLAQNLGLWLSILVLAAAFLLAVLFTVSGVTRRTREFGTLKAIGWTNRRVVGQVAGESVVQGLLGGAIGVALGLAAIEVVNLLHPTLTASASTGAAGGPGGPGGFARVATSAASIALSLPITAPVLGLAVALAILGGLIAGAFGGWRATRLRPAAALRSVA